MNGYNRGHKLTIVLLVFAFMQGTGMSSCNASFSQLAETEESSMPDRVALPAPRMEGPYCLEELLLARRSRRDFSAETLSLAELSQLLWSAQGITDSRGRRTAPSAGALYPLEIYLVKEDGIFHYTPEDHSLRVVMDGDFRKDLYEAGLRQEAIMDAPVTIVIAAVTARTETKYGSRRSPRYVYLEVGHAAQNVLLQAVALDLGAVPIGAFEDLKVKGVMGLPPDHDPVYLIPVGHPD
jgi:SagB-type dehydrogenase family enzyme